jgi:hypothetical protein
MVTVGSRAIEGAVVPTCRELGIGLGSRVVDVPEALLA